MKVLLWLLLLPVAAMSQSYWSFEDQTQPEYVLIDWRKNRFEAVDCAAEFKVSGQGIERRSGDVRSFEFVAESYTHKGVTVTQRIIGYFEFNGRRATFTGDIMLAPRGFKAGDSVQAAMEQGKGAHYLLTISDTNFSDNRCECSALR